MARVLILFAHPAFQRSRINRQLIRAVTSVEDVTVHDLYEAYPDLMIDVQREQQLLQEHDVIVFHHPLYWYSCPALLKEWIDLVLTHGWAYGSKGTALAGKLALQCITTGGEREAYAEGGFNRFTIRQFLAPFDQTCRLCSMTWLGPFAVHGTHQLSAERDLVAHAADYRRLIESLRDGLVDVEAAQKLPLLNDDLGRIIQSPR
jgi:glutathione-regulated potassium-efflux system ancillary protein KefG